MENSNDTQKARNSDDLAADKLPGEFVNDELEEQTKRFLEDVKGRAKRRREAAAEDVALPPPKDDGQRSRRR